MATIFRSFFIAVFILDIFIFTTTSCVKASIGILKLERRFPTNEVDGVQKIKIRDFHRHGRMLEGIGGIINYSLGGEADPNLAGLYYTKIRLGTPVQEFNVDIDTGSDILWVQCNPCIGCPKFSVLWVEINHFDPTKSYSSEGLFCSEKLCPKDNRNCANQSSQCELSLRYADGSNAFGYYLTDMLQFDTILGPSLVANSSALIIFGCSTSIGGHISEEGRSIDGIFGFGPGHSSVISQLSSRRITPKIFSHCLRGDGGGSLVFGEIIHEGIEFSPLMSAIPDYYSLDLINISVNAKQLLIKPSAFKSSNTQGTLVDSGTTLAYLGRQIYDPFVDAITDAISPYATPIKIDGNQCYKLTSSGTQSFPQVVFHFAGGASMSLMAKNYLVINEPLSQEGVMCMGFQKNAYKDITILGDLVLKDKIVVYDLAHQRLGWADYDCSMDLTVRPTYGADYYVSFTALMKISHSYGLIMYFLVMILV